MQQRSADSLLCCDDCTICQCNIDQVKFAQFAEQITLRPAPPLPKLLLTLARATAAPHTHRKNIVAAAARADGRPRRCDIVGARGPTSGAVGSSSTSKRSLGQEEVIVSGRRSLSQSPSWVVGWWLCADTSFSAPPLFCSLVCWRVCTCTHVGGCWLCI